MAVLVAGLVIFLGVHSVAIFAPGLRNARAARPVGAKALGRAAYGLISLIGFCASSCMASEWRGNRRVVLYTTASLDAARHPSSDAAGIFRSFWPPTCPDASRTAAKHPMLAAVEILGVRPSARPTDCWADVLLFRRVPGVGGRGPHFTESAGRRRSTKTPRRRAGSTIL